MICKCDFLQHILNNFVGNLFVLERHFSTKIFVFGRIHAEFGKLFEVNSMKQKRLEDDIRFRRVQTRKVNMKMPKVAKICSEPYMDSG